ncbi:MAG: MFS transporter [Verrucomicrobiota bacterium]
MKRLLSLPWKPNVPFPPEKWPFFYGWVIVVAGMLGTVLSIPGQTMGVSAFTEELMFNLKLTRGELSAAYFTGTCLSGLLLPWVGQMTDRHGCRKMMVVSGALLGFVLLLHSQLETMIGIAWFLLDYEYDKAISLVVISLAFFSIRFLGQGALTIVSRTMVGSWFHLKRGFVYALGGMIVTFGFSVAPKYFTDLIADYGWGGAYEKLGWTVLIGSVLLGWVFYRERPEDSGLYMDGVTREEERQLREKNKHSDLHIEKEMSREEALHTTGFWAFNLALCFFALYSTAYTFHMISIGEELGLPDGRIQTLFIPIGIVSVAATLISGWLADRTRLKWSLLAMLLGLILGNLGIFAVKIHSLLGQAIIVLGLGVAGGIFGMLLGVVWARFFGRKHLGAISGFNMSCIVIASAIGPWLFSFFKEQLASYNGAYILSLVLLILLSVLSFYADNPQRKLLKLSSGNHK